MTLRTGPELGRLMFSFKVYGVCGSERATTIGKRLQSNKPETLDFVRNKRRPTGQATSAGDAFNEPRPVSIRSDSISTGDTQLAREHILDTRIMPKRRPTTDTTALDQQQVFIVSMTCREISVEGTDQVQQNDHDDRVAS